MKIRAIDIGGSAVKTALFEGDARKLKGPYNYEELGRPPHWGSFESWLASRIDLGVDCVAVSCAGVVDPRHGIVQHCGVAGWTDRPLADNLRALSRRARVVTLNDAEAHLSAHIGDRPGPLLAAAMGSALGLAISDEQGRILRTRPSRPLELGVLRLATSAARKQACAALGRPGYDELVAGKGEAKAVEQLGYRLGAFLAELTGAFMLRSIVVSGGFAAHHWDRLRPAVEREYRQSLPDFMHGHGATIEASRWGRQTALVGIARHASSVLR